MIARFAERIANLNELKELIFSLFEGAKTEPQIKDALIKFSQYDLKEQFPFDLYPERNVLGKNYKAISLKENKTRAYFVYKALTFEDNKGEISDRVASTFDPDNSSGKCDFMKELYAKLWGFDYKYSFFGEITAFPEINNKPMLWGGDCLNSLQTSIYATSKYSKYTCIKKMAQDETSFIKEMESSAIAQMFYISHAPGNFGLVPAYFNGYRGMSSAIKDFLPQSLYFLMLEEQNDFSITERLSVYSRNPKYKNGKAKEYFQDYSYTMFRKYVNTMFFWDLVRIEKNGKISILDYAGKIISSFQADYNESSLKSWATGAERFIRRRGIFMAALLWVCYIYNDEYERIRNFISSDEHIVAENEFGYNSVFSFIEENSMNDVLKNVFRCAKNLVKELD